MLSVEIKYHTFESVSHQRQLEKPTNLDQEIYQVARELFKELWNQEPIRLLGIRSSKLSEEGEPVQLSLFDIRFEADPKKEKKEKIILPWNRSVKSTAKISSQRVPILDRKIFQRYTDNQKSSCEL